MADAPVGGEAGTTNGVTTTPDDTPFSLGGHDSGILGMFGMAGVVDNVIRVAQTNVSASALVSAFGSQNVKIELDTLTAFAKKIEALLQAMEGSEAAPYKLQEQRLHADNFGKGFTQSTDLTAAYGKTHDALVKLHKDFVSQIEAMKTAVAKTAGNYAGNEEHTTAAQTNIAKNAGVPHPAAGPNGPGPKVAF
ncbi:hypothetical protein [Kitasatospora sp. NPDC050463]|uniref:hypothetical protein n=1 Tax=Kitasatospora sp. NPDC050463 TaxID=3155786 RepID=UPI0033D33A5A